MAPPFFILALLVPVAQAWKCIPIQSKEIREGVTWKTQNCTKDPDAEPLLTVNSLHVDMSRGDLRVIPAVADPAVQVQSIPDMAEQNPNFIAAINGGMTSPATEQ